MGLFGRSRRKWIIAGTAVRVVADGLILVGGLMLAFVLRYVWLVGVEGTADRTPQAAFLDFANVFFRSLPALILIGLSLFYFYGFYTRGRSYRGRYKALIVCQAVSVTYLAFASLGYVLREQIPFPRTVMPLAWLLTVAAGTIARVWSSLWRQVSSAENDLLATQRDRAIQRVLLIGGAGYIGSALLPKLLKAGYHVRLYDMFIFGQEPIADVLAHPNLELFKGDFRQVDRVVEASRGADAVIHLGGIVGDPACALDEDLTIDVNLMATRMIAEVAKGCRIQRFIFASSCSVYGASDFVLDENSNLNPVSLYARSKIAGEKVLSQVCADALDLVVLRFGTIYGLSGRTRFDLVVNLLTAKAMVDGKMTLFGGDQWRPFVHVEDAASAVLLALRAPAQAVTGQIFNVGSDHQNQTLRQVAELIHSFVPKAGIVDSGSDSDRRNYRVDFGKIRNTLGFETKWTLEQGIQQVMEAIASGRVQDYRDSKYSNVRFLTEDNQTRLVRVAGWERHLLEQVTPLPK